MVMYHTEHTYHMIDMIEEREVKVIEPSTPDLLLFYMQYVLPFPCL